MRISNRFLEAFIILLTCSILIVDVGAYQIASPHPIDKYKVLNVPYHSQGTTTWCLRYAIAMVLEYHGVIHVTNEEPMMDPAIQEINTLLIVNGQNAPFSHYGLPYVYEVGGKFEDLKRLIDQRIPTVIGVFIRYTPEDPGGLHAVTVVGYKLDGSEIVVHDPNDNPYAGPYRAWSRSQLEERWRETNYGFYNYYGMPFKASDSTGPSIFIKPGTPATGSTISSDVVLGFEVESDVGLYSWNLTKNGALMAKDRFTDARLNASIIYMWNASIEDPGLYEFKLDVSDINKIVATLRLVYTVVNATTKQYLLSIRVIDERGNKIPEPEIIIKESGGGVEIRGVGDLLGIYEKLLAAGTYDVSAWKAGYEKLTKRIELSQNGTIYEFQLAEARNRIYLDELKDIEGKQIDGRIEIYIDGEKRGTVRPGEYFETTYSGEVEIRAYAGRFDRPCKTFRIELFEDEHLHLSLPVKLNINGLDVMSEGLRSASMKDAGIRFTIAGGMNENITFQVYLPQGSFPRDRFDVKSEAKISTWFDKTTRIIYGWVIVQPEAVITISPVSFVQGSVYAGQNEIVSVVVDGMLIDSFVWILIEERPITIQIVFLSIDKTQQIDTFIVEMGRYYWNPSGDYKLALVDFSEEGKAGFDFEPKNRILTSVQPWQGLQLEIGNPPRIYTRRVACYEGRLYQIVLDGKDFAVFTWEGIGINSTNLPQVKVYHLDGSEWLGGTTVKYPLIIGGFDGAGIDLVSVKEGFAIFEVFSGHFLQVREVAGFEKLPLEIFLLSKEAIAESIISIAIKFPSNVRDYDVFISGGPYDTSFGINGIVKGMPDASGFGSIQFRPLKAGRYRIQVTVRTLEGRYEGELVIKVIPPWYKNPLFYAILVFIIIGFVLFGPDPLGFLRRRQKPLPIPEIIKI